MVKNKTLLYDSSSEKEFTYADFFKKLNNLSSLPVYVYTSSYFEIFTTIVASIINNVDITLLDYDLKRSELTELGISDDLITKQIPVSQKIYADENNLQKLLTSNKNWQMSLFTSGTTGQPKKVSHTFQKLNRMVKISEEKKNDIWGFAYNPTHIAGIQVFFQAVQNFNSIVILFNQEPEKIKYLIEKFRITNLSATPTFYRLLSFKEKCESITRVTCGGESFDDRLLELIPALFPNAKILNVYASTEAGSLFSSKDNCFIIKDELRHLIKIHDGELLLHNELLGYSDNISKTEKWFNTNDIVEIINDNPLQIKIISRKNEMVNVGGYKVNPIEVEEIINSIPGVILSRVYGKKNSVLGNILYADIAMNEKVPEKEIRAYMNNYLQPFKVPRIINFVEHLETTSTGKLKRIQ